MKKVVITGANGFIAKKVSKVLKSSGYFVIGTSRKPGTLKNYDEIAVGVLGEPLRDVFERHHIDAVVHCAYDRNDLDNVKNAEGTLLWAEQAEKNGVALQIFLSSISADEEAIAAYGKMKFEVEGWFLGRGHVVFRLGLVVGREGLFGRIVSTVENSPVVPLVDAGRTLMHLTDADVLSEIVRDTISGESNIERGRIWWLQQDTPYTFRNILKEIQRQLCLIRVFIPVPYIVVSIALSLLEKLTFLKIGINTNNLKGMRQMSGKRFRSDLNKLGYPEVPLEELIRKVWLFPE